MLQGCLIFVKDSFSGAKGPSQHFVSAMDVPANGFVMDCHQKNVDHFVLNTYKNKLCIKIIRFPREIDWNLHHQHNNLALVWNTIWIRKNRFHLLFRMEFLTNTIWKILLPSSFPNQNSQHLSWHSKNFYSY